MKYLVSIIIAIAICYMGCSQNMILLCDGYKWHYYAYKLNTINSENSIELKAKYVIECNGDTSICNHLYKKIFRIVEKEVSRSAVGFVRELDGKIFGIPNTDYTASNNDFIETYIHPFDIIYRQKASQDVENEYLMYDFNSEMPTGIQEDKWILKSKFYNESYHKMWQSKLNIIVEGVGPDFLGDILCPTIDESYDTRFHRTGLSHITNANNDTVYKGEFFGIDKDYIPLLNENHRWVYYSYNPHSESNYSYYTLFINGDTVINGIKYKKLIRQSYPYALNHTTIAGVLEKRFNEFCDFYEIYVYPLDNSELYANNYSPVGVEDYYIIYCFNRLALMPGPYINRDYDRLYSHFDLTQMGDYLCKGLVINKKEKIFEGVGYDGYYGDLITPMLEENGNEEILYGLSHIEDKNGRIIYRGYYYDSQKLELANMVNTYMSKQVAGVRYYNIAGVESAVPQQGVNIRVTTYTDGSRRTEKILR